jgi:putative SOS response-associated peptidase YedK
MCGRFTQRYSWSEIQDLYDLTSAARNLQPHYNIAPTDPVDVVRPAGGATELVSMRPISIAEVMAAADVSDRNTADQALHCLASPHDETHRALYPMRSARPSSVTIRGFQRGKDAKIDFDGLISRAMPH